MTPPPTVHPAAVPHGFTAPEGVAGPHGTPGFTAAAGGGWVVAGILAVLLGAQSVGSPGPFLAWVSPNGGALALAWLVAALGFGRWARRWLFPGMAVGDPCGPALSAALGVAALLSIDSLLATCGAFRTGTQWPAVAVLAFGIALHAPDTWRACTRMRSIGITRHACAWLAQPWPVWLALPSLALLAVAAAAPPGLLWPSEFGGYDALSYHLQVPREWLALGAAAPLEHNAYSAFPGFVESATLHLFATAQWADVREVAVAAQMLHALLTAVAAWAIGCAAACCVHTHGTSAADRPALARAAAWCFVLGVPWVVVTGSLAYNEMGVLVGFAGAILAWQCGAAAQWHRGRLGLAIGLLLGAAVGSKLTALGMAVVPAIAWVALAPLAPPLATAAWTAPSGRAARARTVAIVGVCAAGVALLVLAPWLWRTWHATGNPVFPFAAMLFGNGWWSAEQVSRFAAAHQPTGGLSMRLHDLWNQAFAYGFGAPPSPREPWAPQWTIAWWAGAAALIALTVRGQRRLALATGAMLAAQLAFWLLATHLKSRFLLPSVVPLGMAVGCALALLGGGTRRTVVVSIALLAWCAQPLLVAWRTPGTAQAFAAAGASGYDGLFAGGGPPDTAQRITDPRSAVPLAWALNHMLPAHARVAAEGEAAVFWCARTPAYGTVWDGGVLAHAMRAHDGEPRAVIQSLADAGYTHVVVNDAMLDVWARAGWLEPAVTPGRIQSVVARLRPVRPFAGMGSGVLFELPQRSGGQ